MLAAVRASLGPSRGRAPAVGGLVGVRVEPEAQAEDFLFGHFETPGERDVAGEFVLAADGAKEVGVEGLAVPEGQLRLDALGDDGADAAGDLEAGLLAGC